MFQRELKEENYLRGCQKSWEPKHEIVRDHHLILKPTSFSPPPTVQAIHRLPWPESIRKPLEKRGAGNWGAPSRPDGTGERQSLGLGIRQGKDRHCMQRDVASAIKSGGTVCNGTRRKEGFLLGRCAADQHPQRIVFLQMNEGRSGDKESKSHYK